MSDTDSDVPVKRRVVKKAKAVKSAVKKRQPVKSRGKGKPRPPISSESESSSSSESESSSDESDSDEERKCDSSSDNSSESEKKETSGQVPSGGFELPTDEDPAKIYVLTGTPASGKSYLCRYIFYRLSMRKNPMFKFGLVISQSAYNGDYDFLPERAVRDKYDPAYLNAYIESLKVKVKEGKEKHGRQWKFPHNFLVLDDCLGMLSKSSKEFNFENFVACHRQTSTSIFILNQYLNASRNVSTLLKNCTNYAFMFPQSLKNSIEAMYNAYGQMFENMEEFRAALDACRERKYSCLVFKNNNEATTASQAYCTIKAGEMPEFKIQF